MRRNVEHHYGSYIVNGELVQEDCSYPRSARGLGWSLSRVQRRNGKTVHLSRRSAKGCRHDGTDGTVKCPDCGITESAFISAAAEFLDSLC